MMDQPHLEEVDLEPGARAHKWYLEEVKYIPLLSSSSNHTHVEIGLSMEVQTYFL